MRLRLLREQAPTEKRVALVPKGVERLSKNGCQVFVDLNAGVGSGIKNEAYESAGAQIITEADQADQVQADLVVSVGHTWAPKGSEPDKGDNNKPSEVFVGVFDPLWAPERAKEHAKAGITTFSLDLVPRITRAQSMDVLSSMATIAGYEAVLLAAGRLPQMFPLMMTAAGTLAPAKVLVLGAGVAGLTAIGTARRLGGVVDAYDVRSEAAEQIRSLGARALEIAPSTNEDAKPTTDKSGYAAVQSEDKAQTQREMLASYVADADVVITTAAVPGRRSPLLVTTEMVEGMSEGSIVVDLAAERGGNCELTKPDQEVNHNGVTILGPTDLTSKCARHSSQMFSGNLVAFLEHLAPDGTIDVRLDDEILSAMLVAHQGEIVHEAVAAALSEKDS